MKKMIIVIITGIAVFIIVTLLMNKCTSVMRDSIENETIKQVETTSKYDLDLTIREYHFITYNQISDYVNYILDNYVDEKFRKFVDTFEFKKLVSSSIYRNERKAFVANNMVYNAQKNIFAYIFKSNSDWTDLPITDNFREKFSKAGSIAKYYNLPEDLIDRGEQKGFSIFITDDIPENYESIEYEFYCTEDDNGYIDNIYYLGRIMHEKDDVFVEFPLEFGYLDNIEEIKECIYELCVSEEYLMKGDYELTSLDTHGSYMYYYKMDRKYRYKVFENNGILPIKDYLKDSLEVISYDEDTKEAIVKIETDEKKIFYKIKLDIDTSYWLNDATVELYREEDK